MEYDWAGGRTRWLKVLTRFAAMIVTGAAVICAIFAASAEAQECAPRKTCSKIDSCEEANWYLDNCPWGGRLDREGDGRPCENLCGSAN